MNNFEDELENETHLLDSPDILHETDKAYLIEHDDFSKPVWLPKSLVTHDPENGIIIPKWLYDKKLEE